MHLQGVCGAFLAILFSGERRNITSEISSDVNDSATKRSRHVSDVGDIGNGGNGGDEGDVSD